ncbi:ECF-type sigma factor [Pirellulaceae bacterium SH501]
MESSLDRWLGEIRSGNPEAQQAIWEAFFPELVLLARRRLTGVRRSVEDEEDVALSVLQSFFAAVEKNCFPDLRGRDSLWRLLSWMTHRKAIDRIRYHSRQKRKVLGESAIVGGFGEEPMERPLEQMIGAEIGPDLEAVFIEELRVLLDLLNHSMRTVALRKLDGYTNAEIAREQNCSIATVERRLKMIREIWTQHGNSLEIQSRTRDADPY